MAINHMMEGDEYMKLTLKDRESSRAASTKHSHFDRLKRKEKLMRELDKKREERERIQTLLTQNRSYQKENYH